MEETTASHPNVRILRGDFRELSFASLGREILLVGNLPYGITSEVLLKLIREREAVDGAVLMVQAEVGAKLVAPPEVDSALIRLRKLTQPGITVPEPAFEETLALIFSGRCKTLRRALLGQFASEEIDRILTEVGLDPRVRGEALPLEALDRLALHSSAVRCGNQA